VEVSSRGGMTIGQIKRGNGGHLWASVWPRRKRCTTWRGANEKKRRRPLDVSVGVS